MIYQYQAQDGEIIERWLPMSEAPDIGAPYIQSGKTYRRIVSLPAAVGLKEHDSNDYPRISRALPRNLEGCPHDAQGRPVILNKAHEREVLKRTGYTREYSPSDPEPPKRQAKPPVVKKTHAEMVADRQCFDAVMRKRSPRKKAK